jgi:hypothetical protein
VTGVDPEAAARKAAEEAEAQRKAEQAAAVEKLVVHEEPLTVRAYRSATAHMTEDEVRELAVRRSRPLVRRGLR